MIYLPSTPVFFFFFFLKKTKWLQTTYIVWCLGFFYHLVCLGYCSISVYVELCNNCLVFLCIDVSHFPSIFLLFSFLPSLPFFLLVSSSLLSSLFPLPFQLNNPIQTIVSCHIRRIFNWDLIFILKG